MSSGEQTETWTTFAPCLQLACTTFRAVPAVLQLLLRVPLPVSSVEDGKIQVSGEPDDGGQHCAQFDSEGGGVGREDELTGT